MKEIVAETLESLNEYIPKLVLACQNTVESLQGGNEATALQMLPPIIEGLEWVLDAVSGEQNNGQLFSIDLKTLTKHFQEMVPAMEMGDYVLLADLLDYELVPILTEWHEIIKISVSV
jgi:hypothetical protein